MDDSGQIQLDVLGRVEGAALAELLDVLHEERGLSAPVIRRPQGDAAQASALASLVIALDSGGTITALASALVTFLRTHSDLTVRLSIGDRSVKIPRGAGAAQIRQAVRALSPPTARGKHGPGRPGLRALRRDSHTVFGIDPVPGKMRFDKLAKPFWRSRLGGTEAGQRQKVRPEDVPRLEDLFLRLGPPPASSAAGQPVRFVRDPVSGKIYLERPANRLWRSKLGETEAGQRQKVRPEDVPRLEDLFLRLGPPPASSAAEPPAPTSSEPTGGTP